MFDGESKEMSALQARAIHQCGRLFYWFDGKKTNILDYISAKKGPKQQLLRVVKCGNSEEVEQTRQYFCFWPSQ